MAEPIDTEALFAAIGLDAILAARPTLHKHQFEQAAALPADIKRRILRFVASDEFKPAVEVPEFDYRATLDYLSKNPRMGDALQLSQEQADALMAALPDPDLATDMAIQANRILTWANGIIPREGRDMLSGGTRVEDPNVHASADFRRQWQVAQDPGVVLGDLEDGSLSDDQVATLALLYPAIYGELRTAVTEALASMEARNKTWEPSPSKAGVIATLMQANATDPQLTAAVQQVYAQDEQAAPPPRRTKAGGGEAISEATPGQKAAG